MTTPPSGLELSPDTSIGELLDSDLPTRLAALEALCGAIAGGDLQDERDQCTGPELGAASVRVHRVCARLTGKRYEWLAAEEADGVWAASESHPRTYASYIAHTHSLSYGNARRQVRLARQLRDEIPAFGAALRTGQLGPDHVAAFASTALTSATRVAALGEEVELDEDAAVDGSPVTVEAFLLDQATQLRADQVRRLGKHFAQVADPEADERGYRQAKQREYVELVRTLDGWHLSGFLTEENGRLVRAAMDAVMTPPAPDDDRTGDQRRAQALADVAHLVLDRGLAGTHASVRPHLGVLISPGDFRRLLREAEEDPREPPPDWTNAADAASASRPPSGRSSYWDTTSLAQLATIDWDARLRERPPVFDDGTGPVPPALLRRLAGCGDVYRVLFSPESEVINLGRTHRLFTAAQRRALVARDRGCTWPGCTAPPSICESHHARIHWADGGPTDLTNGALLCYHHHAVVDTRSITMTRNTGTWTFTRPDGTVLTSDRPPPGGHQLAISIG